MSKVQTLIVIATPAGEQPVLAHEDVATVNTMVAAGQRFVVKTDGGPYWVDPGKVLRTEPAHT
jgi:hypothetical protein